MTKLTSFCLGGCLCIRLLTLKMLRCSESQQLFSSFRSAPTQHSSLSPFASQIISHRMTLNTAKALLHPPCFVCLLSRVILLFPMRTKSDKISQPLKSKKGRNRKIHVSFFSFSSKLPVSDAVRKGLSRVVSQPLTTPPKHTHVRARTNTLLNASQRTE